VIKLKIAKLLRKGKSVEVDGTKYSPYTKETCVNLGDSVVCYLDGMLQVKTVQEIKQINYLLRFLVGTDEDVKKWVGKTKVLGIIANDVDNNIVRP
jgi:hypothetical protein